MADSRIMEFLPEDPILQFEPDTLEQVRNAYNLDNPERLEQSLQILEDWIINQNHFTQKKFDRSYLERVILTTKGSAERAKSQIDSMCTFRTLLPKYFCHCNVREVSANLLDKCLPVPLPKMTKDYHRVFVDKFMLSELKPGDFVSYCRWKIFVCEYLKRHDYIKGFILIMDIRNINILDFIRKISITEVQEIMTIITKGFGARIKEIHVVNEHKLIDVLLQIAKQFLSEKLVSRLKFHDDVETIQKYIDLSILPSEFGGTERSLYKLRGKHWSRKLEEDNYLVNTAHAAASKYRLLKKLIRDELIDVLSSEEHVEYMRSMNQAKTDETKRLQEKFNTLYMGTPGSFRNLSVD